jgi:glycosyltransferase domain-containing protein
MTSISIVILTINKHDYIQAQIKYYADKPVKLIFADGSDTGWGHGSTGQSEQMTWEYFHLPGPDTYWLRLRESLQRVDTEFVMLLDDEDCALFSGITQAVQFLHDHPDFASAGGTTLQALSVKRRLGLAVSKKETAVQINDSSANLRLDKLFSDKRSAQLNYHVHRTRYLSKFANQIATLPTDIPITFAVRALPTFCVLSGKWKAINYPFLIRRQLHTGTKVYVAPSGAMPSEVCQELAIRVCNALVEANITLNEPTVSHQIQSIAEKLLRRYSKSQTSTPNRASLWKRKLAKQFLFELFDVSPRIYKLIRPHGLKTIFECSRLAGTDSPALKKELIALEQLWTRMS